MLPKKKKLYGLRIEVPNKPEKFITSKKEKYFKRDWERQLEEELNDKEEEE